MTIKKTDEEEGSSSVFCFFLVFLLNSSYVLPPRRRLIQFFCPSLKERKTKIGKRKQKKKPRRTNEFRKPNHDRVICGIFWLALAGDMIKFRPHGLCMKE